MFIVAVTGGIATGKSVVSQVFASHGIPVVDADKIARELVEPGKPCWYKIKQVFGDAVFHETKELNRSALGKLIFENRELRGELNKITHPAIHHEIYKQVFMHFMSGHNWIVLDLPLLFEAGTMLDFIYKIITVSCDKELQLARLMERNEYTEEEARKRIDSQMPLEEKCAKSNFVIDNSGSIEQTQEMALQILQLMNNSKQHWFNRIKLLGIVFATCFCIYFLDKTFGFLPKWLVGNRGIEQ